MGLVSKCLKCGAQLLAVGDCPWCGAKSVVARGTATKPGGPPAVGAPRRLPVAPSRQLPTAQPSEPSVPRFEDLGIHNRPTQVTRIAIPPEALPTASHPVLTDAPTTKYPAVARAAALKQVPPPARSIELPALNFDDEPSEVSASQVLDLSETPSSIDLTALNAPAIGAGPSESNAAREDPLAAQAQSLLDSDALSLDEVQDPGEDARRADEAQSSSDPVEDDEAEEDVDLEPRSPAPEVRARPAARWRRVGAWLVDGALLGGASLGLLWVGLMMKHAPPPPAAFGPLDWTAFHLRSLGGLLLPLVGALALLAFAYTAFFARALRGRTPGRFIFRTRLLDASGQRPSVPRALIRAALSLASFMLCLAGFWLSLFDRRGQTLHDKLCSTYVVGP